MIAVAQGTRNSAIAYECAVSRAVLAMPAPPFVRTSRTGAPLLTPRVQHLVLASALLLAPVVPAAAQQQSVAKPDSLTEAENRARVARKGAGLTVGSWDLRGVEPPSGVEVSTLPMISGWFRKGLD